MQRLAELVVLQVADALSDTEELLTISWEFMRSIGDDQDYQKYLPHLYAYGGPVAQVYYDGNGIKTVCSISLNHRYPVTQMVPYKNRMKLPSDMSTFRDFVMTFLNLDVPEVLSTGQPNTPPIPLAAHYFTGRMSQGIAPADPQASYVGPDVQLDLPEMVANWLRVVANILRAGLADRLKRANLSSLNNERLDWEHHLRVLDALLGFLFVNTISERTIEMLAFQEHLENLVLLLRNPGLPQRRLCEFGQPVGAGILAELGATEGGGASCPAFGGVLGREHRSLIDLTREYRSRFETVSEQNVDDLAHLRGRRRSTTR